MIAENISHIFKRVEKACHRVGRDPEEITLIGVTKTFPGEVIREAFAAGLLDFGENYVQEMCQKQEELKDIQVRWHFIGHLQKNKVKSVIDTVHLIHSVDSLPLAMEISKRAQAIGRKVPILVEVNTSGERSKFGVEIGNAANLATSMMALPHISVDGFMTIGPFLPDPEASRPAFRALRGIRDSLQNVGKNIPHLSMGMTNDFEVAIEEGATLIRVGTAIFGARKKIESFTNNTTENL